MSRGVNQLTSRLSGVTINAKNPPLPRTDLPKGPSVAKSAAVIVFGPIGCHTPCVGPPPGTLACCSPSALCSHAVKKANIMRLNGGISSAYIDLSCHGDAAK